MTTVNGLDLRALFNRAMDTRTMREALGDAHAAVLEKTAIKVVRMSGGTTGRCAPWWGRAARRAANAYKAESFKARSPYYAETSARFEAPDYRGAIGRESTIKIAQARSRPSMIQTMLHEIVHLVPPVFSGSRIPWHGQAFYRILADLTDELYPSAEATRRRKSRSWRMYELDWHLTNVFEAQGLGYLPKPREAFSPRSLSDASELPSGAWILPLASALDHAREAEAAGFRLETYPQSGLAIFRR